MTQFAYNNLRNSIIGFAPFKVLYGYQLEISRDSRGIKMIAEKARVLIKKLKELQGHLSRDI